MIGLILERGLNMKTILFDLLATQQGLHGAKFTGGGEYIKTVFKKLCEITGEDNKTRIITFYNSTLFIDEWIKELIDTYNIENYDVSCYEDVTKLSVLQEVDTFFEGLLYLPAKYELPAHIRTIGVFHGFRMLELPTDKTAYLYENGIKRKAINLVKYIFEEKYYERQLKKQRVTINRCDIIVGVSKHSGYAAQMFFPEYDANKIKVFYSPLKYTPIVDDIDSVYTKHIILMLGGNRWEKNVYRGIKAIDELFSAGQLEGYSVKVVGGIPKSIKAKIINKDRFVALGYLTPEDLERVYKECEIFFYPTLNEGFGYPPLEAMKYNKTCVVAADTSLPEIYKDSVYYCNPYDVKEMKTRILQAKQEKISEELIKMHYKRITDKEKDDLLALCELILE